MKRLLPFLLLLASSTVLAESGSYRVEVIVFRNLLATIDVTEVTELRSFSQFPDLEESSKTADPPAEPASDQTGQLPDGLSEVLSSDLPDDLRPVTQKSDQMDNVWRRLRSSKNYRPLVYAAWQQNRIDYYPPMRIHDQQVIASQLRPPTPMMLADLTAVDPLAAYRSSFYHLDGSLQLRRSRFLHLFIDLELREEAPRNDIEASFFGGDSNQNQTTGAIDSPTVYGIYTLNQNRQISTGKMQYFDTPYFGALVYVTNIAAN